MLPISGPFFEHITTPKSSKRIWRFRQARPYNIPAPYQVWYIEGWDRSVYSSLNGYSDSGEVPNLSFSVAGNMPDYGRHRAAAINAAYASLQGKVGDTAGWAENLAQFGKSVDMINNRAVTLLKAFKYIRSGQFGKAAKALSSPPPKGVSRYKHLSRNILEWEYGWSPLVSDISASTKILTETDFNPRRVKGSGHGFAQVVTNSRSGGMNAGSVYSETQVFRIRARCQADVRITNPNLYLAGAMGLIDPALPWKLVPFSFLVDWFVNVEQVLSACSTFLGVSIANSCQSVHETGSMRVFSNTWFPEWYGPSSTYITGTTTATSFRERRDYWRQTGLPNPTLVVRPFSGFSLQRGIQALALIGAIFK